MSEYQYYEFLAIDHALTQADQLELRELSTRARITSTSFTNSYQYGSLKGDPANFMERWFDMHLYVANWNARQLMIRLPKRLVDRARLDTFLDGIDWVTIKPSGDNLILDIGGEEVQGADWDDGAGWLAALVPLRAAVLEGDLRLFYLIWLWGVAAELIEADQPEPMAGIGPLNAALGAFAEFFGLDPDLVEAAAERSATSVPDTVPAREIGRILATMAEAEKTALLARVYEGDPHVRAELRARIGGDLAATAPEMAPRSAGDLLARAGAIAQLRENAAKAKKAAEAAKLAKAALIIRRARLDALAARGEPVWREIEGEIERRNAAGYDRAASLLADLHVIAGERGTLPEFSRRLAAILQKHAQKKQFVARLAGLA